MLSICSGSRLPQSCSHKVATTPRATRAIFDLRSSRQAKFRLGLRPSDYPLYFTDLDPINLGDLGLRHSVVCQGTNATELGRRNVKRRAFGGGPPFNWFRFRRDHGLWRRYWHHWRDHKDARLAPRLFFGRAGAVQRGRRTLPRRRPRLEQIFRILTRSVDPFAITMRV